ncbi:hypothetical protein EON62_01475 [archaeon]|nr:MAG: hypothetical protein EON62_01475 [archaeon]
MTAWSQLATALVAAVSVGITVWTLRLRQRTQPSHFVKLGASDAAVRLLQKGRRKMLSNLLDVGGFFGIDMGGSLTKVVVFLPDDELADRTLELARKRGIPTSDWEAKLARIHSVANFFMSRTTYGMTGVRDAHLSFHMRELGGAFHFIRYASALRARSAASTHIRCHACGSQCTPLPAPPHCRFETRRMEGAMRLVQQHRIHETMKTICTTGGGSVRVCVASGSRVLARAGTGSARIHPPITFMYKVMRMRANCAQRYNACSSRPLRSAS